MPRLSAALGLVVALLFYKEKSPFNMQVFYVDNSQLVAFKFFYYGVY